ncbi:hypothetical protein LCGC14_0258720 [marine sediment metagenome]|uniref:Uncharacterized protein n=1 Tax=marine sediment metagenome TaxID=412755 RepID=A0A0F9UJ87_9ZZZZ
MSFASGPKVRGALINEDTGEAQGFMFNPRQLVASIQVNWDKAPGIGASFERLGYRNTSNPEFNLTLLHNLTAWIARTRKPGETINATSAAEIRTEFERHRNFLIALCYPRGRWNDVLRRSPPTALLMWPGYLAIRVVINSLQLTDKDFNEKSKPIVFEAACVFQEHRIYRLTSADAYRKGFMRAEQG